ncbi:hypothetical protein OURE66S_00328 [Oligella ureolytica]
MGKTADSRQHQSGLSSSNYTTGNKRAITTRHESNNLRALAEIIPCTLSTSNTTHAVQPLIESSSFYGLNDNRSIALFAKPAAFSCQMVSHTWRSWYIATTKIFSLTSRLAALTDGGPPKENRPLDITVIVHQPCRYINTISST